jgi:hypothetical protein
VRRASSTRVAAACGGQVNGAPDRSASACVQANGGAVIIGKGKLVLEGVAISDTSATVRRPRTRAPVGALDCVRGAGLRWTGAVCRITEARFSWPMAPSRSKGAARSRARRRCARPDSRNPAVMDLWYCLRFLAVAPARVLGLVPSREQFEHEYVIVILVNKS